MNPSLAIIGGSGFYRMPGLTNLTHIEIETPFGQPSSPISSGNLNGNRIVFISRHGIGHHIPPSKVNYRANIYALKQIGAQKVISVSACGSLREDFAPGDIVIPDNLFDFTKTRDRTFFSDGIAVHISPANPFCKSLSSQLFIAVQSNTDAVHMGGNLITIEGPRFSTKAESNTFRAWGMSAINMSTAPEAFLAREAEMCYAVMNHVTDYDVWHVSEEPVTVDMIVKILQQNTKIAQESILSLVDVLDSIQTKCDCQDALSSALITSKDVIPDSTRDKLSLLLNKYY